MASFFPDQIQKLLFQYLLFYSTDPLTFFNLCLVNKFCAKYGKEVSPMKKGEFSAERLFVSTTMKILPNGWIHGVLRKDGEISYVYHDSRIVMACNVPMFYENVFGMATKHFFIQIREFSSFSTDFIPFKDPYLRLSLISCPLCRAKHVIGRFPPGMMRELYFSYQNSCFGRMGQMFDLERRLVTLRRRSGFLKRVLAMESSKKKLKIKE